MTPFFQDEIKASGVSSLLEELEAPGAFFWPSRKTYLFLPLVYFPRNNPPARRLSKGLFSKRLSDVHPLNGGLASLATLPFITINSFLFHSTLSEKKDVTFTMVHSGIGPMGSFFPLFPLKPP